MLQKMLIIAQSADTCVAWAKKIAPVRSSNNASPCQLKGRTRNGSSCKPRPLQAADSRPQGCSRSVENGEAAEQRVSPKSSNASHLDPLTSLPSSHYAYDRFAPFSARVFSEVICIPVVVLVFTAGAIPTFPYSQFTRHAYSYSACQSRTTCERVIFHFLSLYSFLGRHEPIAERESAVERTVLTEQLDPNLFVGVDGEERRPRQAPPPSSAPAKGSRGQNRPDRISGEAEIAYPSPSAAIFHRRHSHDRPPQPQPLYGEVIILGYENWHVRVHTCL